MSTEYLPSSVFAEYAASNKIILSTLKRFSRVLRWFDGFNWEGLRQRKLQAPIIPKVC